MGLADEWQRLGPANPPGGDLAYYITGQRQPGGSYYNVAVWGGVRVCDSRPMAESGNTRAQINTNYKTMKQESV